MKGKYTVALAGILVGLLALLLGYLGNPANMAFCIACFLRDTAGALKLHAAAPVQYLRPEILGLGLGAFGMALARKEFAPKAGSAPATRFVLGFLIMVGALVFLGCPLRMMLRIAGGDLNAVVGLFGFAGGIGLGILALNRGFSLRRAYPVPKVDGVVFPGLLVVGLAFLLFIPGILAFSAEGPGSQHAPLLASLAAGLLVGAAAQRSRLCTMGGFRDAFLFRDFHLLSGFIAIVVIVAIGNLAMGNFQLGFEGQPIAHTDGVWNFLGMALVGFASVLLGGCPLRQLILAGEGNIDSVVAVIGMIAGAAFAHNFGLASSPQGPTPAGQGAVMAGFAVAAAIAVLYRQREKGAV